MMDKTKEEMMTKENPDEKEVPESSKDSKYYYIQNEKRIDELSNSFIRRLVSARKAKGYTQEKLADLMGLTKPAIRKYEQGQSLKKNNFTLKHLAETLEVSTDYLLDVKINNDSDLDDITKKYGLKEEALKVLSSIHRDEGGEIQHGYMDFLNCFLGNGDITYEFIAEYARLTKQKYKAPTKSLKEDITYQMNKVMTSYIDQVVLPSFEELYETGTYTVHPLEKYLHDTDDEDDK